MVCHGMVKSIIADWLQVSNMESIAFALPPFRAMLARANCSTLRVPLPLNPVAIGGQ